MFNVKRIESIHSLILEAEIINIGGQIDDIMDGDQDGPLDANELLNRLLDSFLKMGDDLDSKLDDPAFEKYFGDPRMRPVMDSYFNYLKERIATYQKKLVEALSKKDVNQAEVARINGQISQFANRIQTLDKIYEKLKAKDKTGFSQEVHEKVKVTQDEIASAFSLRVIIPAENTRRAYQEFEDAQTEEAQREAAEDLFNSIYTAEVVTEDMPEEVTSGIKAAEREYSIKVDAKLGKGASEEMKKGLFINKNTASVIRRIFQYQYTNWSNEADIIREGNALRVSINGFPDVTDEAKEYLTRMVDGIQKSLIEKAKSKEFDTKSYKGIHYDFNKKLPLYERTALPVNGKQIADETKIMKFRKAAQSLMDLVFGETSDNSPEGQAFRRAGKHLHKIYAKTINTIGKKVGKLTGGREGEMKADAFTRLFILDTSVVDEPKAKPVSEEGVAPGVSPQVPGSIGAMGPIVPPTPTSIGSGDNFATIGHPTKKKKKKSSFVMGFSDFINEKNN